MLAYDAGVECEIPASPNPEMVATNGGVDKTPENAQLTALHNEIQVLKRNQLKQAALQKDIRTLGLFICSMKAVIRSEMEGVQKQVKVFESYFRKMERACARMSEKENEKRVGSAPPLPTNLSDELAAVYRTQNQRQRSNRRSNSKKRWKP